MSDQALNNADDLLFAPEDSVGGQGLPGAKPGWKILLVDDEPAIHEVTKLALANFEFDGRPLCFLHAYSGEQARQLLSSHPDIAVAMVDVVMEDEHAGLDLVRHIRETLQNQLVRLILRTGQPGQAPERTVIRDYDINDYKEKTELSAQKLYSTVLTSLRSYRSLWALEHNRRGLEQIIDSSGMMFSSASLQSFIQGVLEQMIALLNLDVDATYLKCDSMAVENRENHMTILAATGGYSRFVGKEAGGSLPPGVLGKIRQALETKRFLIHDDAYIAYFQSSAGHENVLYITSSCTLSDGDAHLVELFCRNAAIAHENILLRDEIEGTQRDIVYMLGEAIETRSKETGQHVRRVAEYCRLFALGMGLSEREAEILRLAAPLHDFGKIGIPDHILHKPGRLDDEEWKMMRAHASMGQELLSRSKREILRAAAIIAGQHHEKWDGSGYPLGLQGEEIHLYGRIGALADVFDALSSRRCYKEAWDMERILGYLQEQRGAHFDPRLVDWLLANLQAVLSVRVQFPDEL